MSPEPTPSGPEPSEPTPRTPRKTAGTRFFVDVIREPSLWWWGVRGGNPATAEQDLHDLRTGTPLCSVAFLWNGRTYLQGLLFMDPSASEPLTWRRWRFLRPFAPAVPLPERRENFDTRRATLTEAFVKGLTDHTVITFDAAGVPWTLAVVNIDLPVVWEALTGIALPSEGAGR